MGPDPRWCPGRSKGGDPRWGLIPGGAQAGVREETPGGADLQERDME